MAKRRLDEIVNENLQIIKQSKFFPNGLSEDGSLKYDFMISLKNITKISIISYLWMDKHNQQNLINLFDDKLKLIEDKDYKRKQIINNLMRNVSALPLPNSIIMELGKIIPILENSLFKWIKYHDVHIFETNEHSTYSAVNFIKDIKWTMRGKVDYEQTAKYVFENKDISDKHKYILACTYCLEDKIALVAPKILEEYFIDSICIYRYPMVYYWTSKLIIENKILCNPSYYYYCSALKYNVYINQRIINILMKNYQTYNEVPIKYMWKKLRVKERADISASIIEGMVNQDFKYSVLSSLDPNQQRKVFKMCSKSILAGMLDDWLWEKYFLPTALNIFDIMTPLRYAEILKVLLIKINDSWKEGDYIYNQYKYFFKELWKNGSKQLKTVFLRDYFFEEHVICELSWEWDIDIIKLIFNDLNLQEKKNIMNNYRGINMCIYFIENDQWNLLESFIQLTISSEADLNELKQKLIKGYSVAEQCIRRDAWDRAEYFVNWAFNSEEEKSQFKESLLSTITYNYLSVLLENYKINFDEFEKRIKWYSSDNLITIKKLKAKIPKIYFNKLFYLLILKDKYEELDDFLNWCFLHDQSQIVFFKSNMYKDEDIGLTIQCLIDTMFMQKDDPFASLDKFANWCFSSSQEKIEFQIWVKQY